MIVKNFPLESRIDRLRSLVYWRSPHNYIRISRRLLLAQVKARLHCNVLDLEVLLTDRSLVEGVDAESTDLFWVLTTL